MASRSRALARMLRHSGLGRSLASFIAVGLALVLGHPAGPSVFPGGPVPCGAATPGAGGRSSRRSDGSAHPTSLATGTEPASRAGSGDARELSRSGVD